MTNDSKQAAVGVKHEPFRISLRGESVVLTDDDAKAILRTLHQQSSARRDAEEAAARAAGQVWFAVYWHLRVREEEECFSLRDAVELLETGEDLGTLSSDSIRCPDGTVYTREDLPDGVDWRTLPALKVSA